MTGADVRASRRRLGWTQRRLAEALGTTRQTIYRWEHGDSLPPAFAAAALAHVERVQSEERARVTEEVTLSA